MNRILSLAALLVAALGWAGAAFAATAGAVTIAPNADCTSNANLLPSWTGAGNHWEYGVARDAAGAIIGTFGPDASANDSWNATYLVPITTAQNAGSRIMSYAWVGSNPPTPATAIEFAVVYNCSTKVVLYTCSGAYGTCATTVAAAVAAAPAPGNTPAPIPTTSREVLFALVLLLSALGAFVLRRPRIRSRTPPH